MVERPAASAENAQVPEFGAELASKIFASSQACGVQGLTAAMLQASHGSSQGPGPCMMILVATLHVGEPRAGPAGGLHHPPPVGSGRGGGGGESRSGSLDS